MRCGGNPRSQALIAQQMQKRGLAPDFAWDDGTKVFWVDLHHLTDPAHNKELRSHRGWHPDTVHGLPKNVHLGSRPR